MGYDLHDSVLGFAVVLEAGGAAATKRTSRPPRAPSTPSSLRCARTPPDGDGPEGLCSSGATLGGERGSR